MFLNDLLMWIADRYLDAIEGVSIEEFHRDLFKRHRNIEFSAVDYRDATTFVKGSTVKLSNLWIEWQTKDGSETSELKKKFVLQNEDLQDIDVNIFSVYPVINLYGESQSGSQGALKADITLHVELNV